MSKWIDVLARRRLAGLLALLALGAAACRQTSTQPSPEPAPAPSAVPVPTVAAPFAAPPVLPGTPDVATLVARVTPSVVNITTEHELTVPREGLPSPFGDWPFGGMFGPRGGGEHGQRQRALGSGFVVDHAGHVVTNAHVIADADVVKVKLADGREFPAKVKGKDTRLDLAVLELEGAKDLVPVALGSSDALRVGEYVIAIGNPFGLGNTVTMGIVSAKSRTIGAGPYDNFVQTDASINPGNSGGPLFNLRGEVVGINTAINPQGKGIGFAIPSDALKDVLGQLLASGHVARGRLGVVVQPVDEAMAKALGLDRPHGALVADVEPSSPAAKAGFESGDVIVGVEGADVASSEELPRLVARHAPGSTLSFRVLRKGSEKTVRATLDALDEQDTSARPAAPAAPVAPSSRLGVVLSDAEGAGARVQRVVPGAPAEDHLVPGDVIVEVNRARVSSAKDVAAALGRAEQGAPILLRVERNGRILWVAVPSPRT